MNHGCIIRVPMHTAERIRKITAVRNRLLQETGEEPSIQEIAECCELSPEKVRRLLQLSPQTCSLDAPTADEESTLGALVEDHQTPQPQEKMVREELSHTMKELLGMLTDRQQQVLRLRYGMTDGTTHSLEEIGKILGISKERVRQIERQAMEKLQKYGASMGLEDFLQ
jgi:RNA polymerase primary sigma factor